MLALIKNRTNGAPLAVLSALFALSVLAPLCSCASQTRTDAAPAWISDPKSVYPDEKYISAVGDGVSLANAEDAAFANLSRFFKTEVISERTFIDRYAEAVSDGVFERSQSSEMTDQITTSARLGSLIGAEIKDTWLSPDGRFYALAAMDRQKTAALYSSMISDSVSVVDSLTRKAQDADEPLYAYACYSLSAMLAKVNEEYLSVLYAANYASWRIQKENAAPPAVYTLAASETASNIAVSVETDGDIDGRIQTAFASLFAAKGFRVADKSEADYSLTASVKFERTELGNNPNKFVRYALDSSLNDKRTGKTLFPYAASGREGHITDSEALQRALRALEKKITGDYGTKFDSYLDSMIIDFYVSS